MKRAGNLFDSISSLSNLALAAHKAFRGKSETNEVKIFRKDFLHNINLLRTDLIRGNFTIGNYHKFVIYEPKERIICAAPIKQRILHHAIMNVCHPVFERNLIYDSYASRPGKGTHKAIKRLKEKIMGYKYYAKLDVRKFFDSINHVILKRLLRRLFKDEQLLCLFDAIINSYGVECGLPIGNLTSQYFANYYLSPLDHFMKEDAKALFYIRYMDDVIILDKEIGRLKQLTKIYCEYAQNELKLCIKPPIIGRVCNGVPFLGYKIFPHNILMNGKGKRRFIKGVKLIDHLFNKSIISEKEYSTRIASYLSYACFADSHKFRKRLLKNWINVKEL